MKEKDTIISHMRAVQREAEKSPIPVYKIAALIHGVDPTGEDFITAQTNHWPDIIHENLGVDQKIGNSSPSIHAETAVLTQSPHATKGTDLYVTDPMCPNCMKNIVEARIKRLFIDQQGFERKYYQENQTHVDDISMAIAKRAGISVFSVNTSSENIETIYEADAEYTPPNDSPIEVREISSDSDVVFNDIIQNAAETHKKRKHAIALVTDAKQNKYALIARSHMVIGYSAEDKDDSELINKSPGQKYSFIQEPVNRLIMFMAAHGYQLINGYLYCSVVPTSREQVNLVGSGVKEITIGNKEKCRDEHGLQAMQTLKEANILAYF